VSKLSSLLGTWLNKNQAVVVSEEVKLTNLPKHEQARHMVEKLASRGDQRFNAIKAGRIELLAINANIAAFVERINHYAEKLELGQSLSPTDCFAEMRSVTLDGFFTDEKGMYIPISTLEDFLKSARRLLTVVERGLARKESGIEYSVRLMGKCFTSIHNVCKAVEDTAN
jgi:hypothetical protein